MVKDKTPLNDNKGNLSPEVRKLVDGNFPKLLWKDGSNTLPAAGDAELRQALHDFAISYQNESREGRTTDIDYMMKLIADSRRTLIDTILAEDVPEKVPYLQDSDGNYLDDKEPRAKIRVVANEAIDQFTANLLKRRETL